MTTATEPRGVDPEDAKSRGAGVLFVLVGAGLTAWAWSSGLRNGQYSLKAAMLGPTLLVLGIGMLIHGRGIPTAGATMLTRSYGVAGGLATILSLFLLGYFGRPHRSRVLGILETALPFALLLVWFLPSRVFGAPDPPPPAPDPIARPEPIEPR